MSSLQLNRRNLLLVTQGLRGLWLAKAAARRGHEVTVLLTQEPELDVDQGPFGLFVPDRRAEAQELNGEAIDYWCEQWVNSDMGLLSDSGTWSFAPQVFGHRASHAGIHAQAISLAISGSAEGQMNLGREPFPSTWPGAFVSDLPHLTRTSAAGRLSRERLHEKRIWGWGGGVWRPKSSEPRTRQDGFERNLQVWQQQLAGTGVRVEPLGELMIEACGETVSSVECNGRRTELGLMVSLVSEEQMAECLGNSAVAYWRWVPRTPEKLRNPSTMRWWSSPALLEGNEKLIEVLPSWLALVNDLEIPWSEDNLLIVHREAGSLEAKLWFRTELQPTRDRGDWVGLLSRHDGLLAKRCPGVRLKPNRRIDDHLSGPALRRRPAVETRFSSQSIELSALIDAGRVLQLGPETWSSWTWNEVLRAESIALRNLI